MNLRQQPPPRDPALDGALRIETDVTASGEKRLRIIGTPAELHMLAGILDAHAVTEPGVWEPESSVLQFERQKGTLPFVKYGVIDVLEICCEIRKA